MSSFHAGVTTGLNVLSSAGDGTGGEVVDDAGDADGGGGWGLLFLVPGFDGLLSECKGG
jgi:hypothetical protein